MIKTKTHVNDTAKRLMYTYLTEEQKWSASEEHTILESPHLRNRSHEYSIQGFAADGFLVRIGYQVLLNPVFTVDRLGWTPNYDTPSARS
jgi:hypothetical protein